MVIPFGLKSRSGLKPSLTDNLRYGCLLVMASFVFSACSSARLTPITRAANGVHQPGMVVWHDLLTRDVESAKRFYGRLFGWAFEQNERYTIVLNEGVAIAGMVDTTAKKRLERAWWLAYLSVAEVDDNAEWVKENGGTVIKGPAEMVNRGRYVVIKDPQGAPLVLLRSASGDPVPAVPAMNGWLWNELWTSDTEAALEFYQLLGSYAADLVTAAENPNPYWVLVADQRWQAGITTVPFENIPPQWVPVVRVADPMAIADQVVPLGGRVLIRPDHPLGNGHLALIEDPSGAILMVESWAPESRPGKEQ
jgi:predicted enzyme related to lactoylglutathione lyase